MKFILFFLCCISQAAFCQQDAWVYFADKENVETSLENPIFILSQSAIDRKKLHSISIDARDVPVNPTYISAVKTVNNITVFAKSKWMNALHVRGGVAAIKSLFNLEFVRTIDFADKNLPDLSRPTLQDNKFTIEANLEDFEYGSAQNQTDMIHVGALHIEDFTGHGIIIAVFDSGFPNVATMASFERLRTDQNLLDGYDFVNRTSAIYDYSGSSHGTRVLSTMAGYIENKFVGTAPDASYYLFRTEESEIENPIEESYWVEAAERADSLGVHIITSSLGYNTFDNPNYNYTPSEMDGTTTFISRGATIASQKGILVVNSAGNSGNTPWGIVTAPADAKGVFTVGAVNGDGLYASFSSRGSNFQPTQKPDVVAQGLGSFVIDETDSIVNNNGTSFSAPIVAGAIASLWQAMPTASAEQIKQYVRMSASQYDTPDYLLGFGIPDFEAALALTLSTKNAKFNTFKVYPNPVAHELHLKLPSSNEDRTLRVYDVLGKKIIEQMYKDAYSKIDVSALVSGIYLLKIDSKTTAFNFQFIKF
ncbi:S8 family serine peptidase [Gelidibacter salicanalis]|uniref:S8 family serine peptidase n=1 Tax=Gelidibacter salicanalis TaxID=291193 RepID=A0A934NHT6_9FLAO|nr:S8 family serine peptidase [Gelidibacter salicanalis]MBJ7879284.1 S8 family serine peptidase [Gelidibacter salicanalis]